MKIVFTIYKTSPRGNLSFLTLTLTLSSPLTVKKKHVFYRAFFIADTIFVLGNAQISENPIVYTNDGFCKFTGFTRAEVMKKNCDLSFLFGQQTDPETVRELHSALQAKSAIQKEIIAYKKDGKLMTTNHCVYFTLHSIIKF